MFCSIVSWPSFGPKGRRSFREEISARVEVAKKPEVLAAKHTTRRGYRNAKDMNEMAFVGGNDLKF